MPLKNAGRQRRRQALRAGLGQAARIFTGVTTPPAASAPGPWRAEARGLRARAIEGMARSAGGTLAGQVRDGGYYGGAPARVQHHLARTGRGGA